MQILPRFVTLTEVLSTILT